MSRETGTSSTGKLVEFDIKVLPPRLPWLRWKAKIRYRVVDDDDLFLCPWMDFFLEFLGGSLGYSCAAWTRSGLDSAIYRVKSDILDFSDEGWL